jgi:hypothetical protein
MVCSQSLLLKRDVVGVNVTRRILGPTRRRSADTGRDGRLS